ncbi:hypothetical protein [Amphibiibacter pelophylacis]|uniref:Uncharacterized protein n=1 Tax=Amphibiibacter pelophylacis TaxID=1799477 RepID=A0ACC6P3U0_9BURK
MFYLSSFPWQRAALSLLSATVLALAVAPQPVLAAKKAAVAKSSKSKRAKAPKVAPFVLYENWEGLSTPALVERANAISKMVGLQDSDALLKVLLQETRLGRLGGFWRAAGRGLKSEPYYGIGQMKLSTAMDVLKSEPRWLKDFKLQPDEDLIRAHLTINDRFSAVMAAVYLKQLSRQYQGDALLNAYNRGPTGVKGVADDFHYAVSANAKFYEVFPEKKPLVVTAADCQPIVAAQTLATSIGPTLGTGTAALGAYDPSKDPLIASKGRQAKVEVVQRLDKQVKEHARGGKPAALSSDPRFAEACAKLSLVASAADTTAKPTPGKTSATGTVRR